MEESLSRLIVSVGWSNQDGGGMGGGKVGEN